jgi:hypothetical protein
LYFSDFGEFSGAFPASNLYKSIFQISSI